MLVVDAVGTVPSLRRAEGAVVIIELTGNGVTYGTATEIPAIASTVIVKAVVSSGNTAFRLSPDFQIGDVVEMFGTVGTPAEILTSSPEVINSSQVVANNNNSVRIRKVTAEIWLLV